MKTNIFTKAVVFILMISLVMSFACGCRKDDNKINVNMTEDELVRYNKWNEIINEKRSFVKKVEIIREKTDFAMSYLISPDYDARKTDNQEFISEMINVLQSNDMYVEKYDLDKHKEKKGYCISANFINEEGKVVLMFKLYENDLLFIGEQVEGNSYQYSYVIVSDVAFGDVEKIFYKLEAEEKK